jgi:hypothetical protein
MIDISFVLTVLVSFSLGALVMFLFGLYQKLTSQTPITASMEETDLQMPDFVPFRSLSNPPVQFHEFNQFSELASYPDDQQSSVGGRTRSISFESNDFTNSSENTQIPSIRPTLRMSPVLNPAIHSDIQNLSLLQQAVASQNSVETLPTNRPRPVKSSEKLKALEIEPLENDNVLKSNFWRPVILSNLDAKMSFCPQELTYRFTPGKKVNFDGFWKSVDIEKPFRVEQRIVDYGDGNLDCILFDFSLNDWVCDRSASVTQGSWDDVIVWSCDDGRNPMKWERYTIIEALTSHLKEDVKLRLPKLCMHLITEFIGQKAWVPRAKRSFPIRHRKSFFSESRCKEVQIALRSMGLKCVQDYEIMKERILNVDITEEELSKLMMIIPNDDELEFLKGKKPKLFKSKTDKWFLIMSSIPNLSRRLETWSFILHFPKELQSSNDIICVLERSEQAISENQSLKLMFALILSVCNFINEGTAWGNAYGFKLETLEKLTECRGSKESLLFYIVLVAHQKHPGALRFVHELSILSNASKICEDIHSVDGTVHGLGNGIRLMHEDLENERFDETFASFVEAFLYDQGEKFQFLLSYFESTMEAFKHLGKDLGTPEAHLRANDFSFIETLNEFRQRVQAAITKISETKEIQERKMMVQQRWHQQFTRQRNGSGGSMNSSSSEDEVHEFIRVKENLDRKRKIRKDRERKEKYLSELLGKSLEFDNVELSKIPFPSFEEEENLSS